MVAALAEPVLASTTLNLMWLFEAVVSKFVPLMVTGVQPAPSMLEATPIVGLNPVIVGASRFTLKSEVLVAEPVGVITEIGPVDAPAGTEVTNCVALAEITDALTPLNWIVFSVATVLKPVP